MLTIEDIELVQTCGACPEQYDAFIRGTETQIGYLRLRHGYFRVDYPDCGGETVYEAYPEGDGCFDEDEKDHFLFMAKSAVIKKHNSSTSPERSVAENDAQGTEPMANNNSFTEEDLLELIRYCANRELYDFKGIIYAGDDDVCTPEEALSNFKICTPKEILTNFLKQQKGA